MKGKTKLTGRIVIPGAPDYEQARMDYNSQISKYPKVIVFCQCIEDVVNAVKWSRENDIHSVQEAVDIVLKLFL